MDPITLAAVMGGAGLLKSELIDKPREQEQRRQAAITARWSPWTGMAPGAIQSADPFGSAIQGGLAGAMIGQNIQGAEAGKAKDVTEASLAGGTEPQSMQQFLTQQEMQNAQNQSMMSPYQKQYASKYPFMGM